MLNIPEKFWKAATLFVLIATIFGVFMIIKQVKMFNYVGANPNQVNSITVDGTGDAVVIPDVATFSFTVTQTAKTVADAQSAATDKINSALKAVRDSGVADKDIQTTSYNIYPHYESRSVVCPTGSNYPTYCPGIKDVLTGYDVSESFLIKVRDLSKAGTIFTSIGSLGVQNVGGLAFSVDKPDTVKAEARAVAIKNAQDKANELANQLGVSLVRIISFSENNNTPGPIVYGLGIMKTGAVANSAAAPEISAGEQKVTDNVTITYEIR